MTVRRSTLLSLSLVAITLVAGAASTAQASGRGRGSDDRSNDARQEDRRDDRSGSGSNGTDASATRREVRFIARMRDTDSATSARARYSERVRTDGRGGATQKKFDVEVERATPGQVFEVRVNGKLMTTITANSLGRAEVEFRPTPDSPNDIPTPANFPRIKAGDRVTVGDLSGTFSLR